METYNIQYDIRVFGRQVITFPLGVKNVFDELVNTVPERLNRSFYGLSHLDTEGNVIYYAAVEEYVAGEGKKLGYDYYTIEKGEYLSVAIKDWHSKTDSIKDVFHEMMQDKRFDNITPCVEWYKSDQEMICMVKMDMSQ